MDDSFHVIGLATRTTNAAEGDPATSRLRDLWERVYRDPELAARRAQNSGELVAVLTDYESDESGAYTQIVGVRVASPGDLPEGLVAVRVPAEDRHHVPARGPMPAALIAVWQDVWQQTASGRLDRAFRTDYEVHIGDGADLFVSVNPVAGPA